MKCEDGLDSAAKICARSAVLTARFASLAEALVDWISFRIVRLVAAAADSTERAEIGLFAAATQWLAEAIASLGGNLRATEPGTVYLYLAGSICTLITASLIFAWAAM
jgi:hypothetical protein